jgi:hypothetical protein
MTDSSAPTYGVADQLAAGAASALVVGAAAALYGSSGLTPTFAISLLAASAAASLQRAVEYRRGKRAISDLKAVDRNYWQWTISAIAFGFLLPALFPDGAYSSARWLLSFNGLLLLFGLAAIPALKLNGRFVATAAAFRCRRAG